MIFNGGTNMANFIHANKSVPIPMEFINNYMPHANATYVKVYLYGLLKCYEGIDVSNATIAEALDILETDVNKAWRYWKRVGLMHSEGKGTLVYDNVPENGEKNEMQKAETPVEEAKIATEKNSSGKQKDLPEKELPKSMSINTKMKETVKMAEQLLKRSLSRREVTLLYNFEEWYSMSQEMILVLLEYCVTIDKTSFSYIEKVASGIYIDTNKIEDNYYVFGLSMPNVIYSHMTALYFHGLSIKAPNDVYDITVKRSYNSVHLRKHNVFYVDNDIYELGLTEIETLMGNKVKVYDIERCICDIIRSKNRMDLELIKHSVKEYIKRKDKDLVKLSLYAEKLGIKEVVMDYVSMMYE